MEKIAIYQLEGATCTGCKIAIESVGKKINGVKDIFIDGPTNQIQVTYEEGIEDHKEKIPQLVESLGYETSLVHED